jgi:lipopolysaccharide export system ATP-binding protein
LSHPNRLQTEKLVKTYGKRRVVNEVSLHLDPGEIVGLLGPNGAGKTTTFNMVVGVIRPDSGKVTLAGRDLSRLPLYKRARLGLGYLAQKESVFQKMTVEQNLLAVLEFTGLDRKQREDRTELLLEELSISHLARNIAGKLSGGERRRTEIARALAMEPDFLLLDEPFAGVDPRTVEELQAIVQRLRDRGLGILITDHNVRETLAVTDRAYIIHEGVVLKHGPEEVLVNDPEVRKLYLGEGFYTKSSVQTAEPALMGSGSEDEDR